MKRLISSLLYFFILSSSFAFADHVDPLLDGWVRQQKDPFNRCCPFYIENGKDTGQRCQVGCVATALESIISYHRREIVLQKTLPAWSSDNFKTVDLPAGTTVDTRLILLDYGNGTAASVGMSEEDYAASVDAVSRLCLMCGMMAQMNWGLGASGADAGNLVEPMKDIVGWKTAEYIDSYKYTPEKWREILKNELRNGRPILYTGYTMNIDGHAFVVDGFDEQDRFHVNWGYGGSYDGNYYDITQLCAFANPADTNPIDIQQGFFCNQQALLLSPDEVDLTLVADSVKRTGYEIEVEKVTIDETALTGKYTPVTFTLHNVSDQSICSPFEIFTNATSDADLFREGDYGALFGVNMEPDERLEVTVQCLFSKKGYRNMHISPDDVTVLADTRINIVAGKKDELEFSPVSVEFRSEPADDEADATVSATFSVPVRNVGVDRSGAFVTYGLMQGTEVKDGDWRHYDYYHLPLHGEATKTVTFKGLKPGEEHLFVVRQPWTIRQSYKFTVPTGIVGVEQMEIAPNLSEPDAIYDLAGRRVTQPTHGLLIHNGKKTIR